MYEKISIEKAKELMKSERYQDMLKAYESKALEFNFAPSPSLVEEMKIKFFIEFYSNTYLRKYPDRVYTEETVSSSVVSAPKVSSDTISNDADKDLAITDIAGGTGVTTELLKEDTISNDADKDPAITDIAGGTGVAIELLKEDTNLSESTDLISSNNVSVAELPKNSDEILAIIPTNSDSVNYTEQSDNKDQYSSNIDEELLVTDEELLATDEEENLDEKASVTSSDNEIDIADEGENLEEDASVTSSDNEIDIAEEPLVDSILEALPSITPSSTNDEYVVKCPAVDTKSPFASFVSIVTSAWYSLTKMFHSKTESTEAAVLDTSDSLPEKSSVFGDNLNDDVDTIGGISEVNLFDQD